MGLFGNRKPRAVNLPGPGEFDFDIVGESNYQKELASICGNKTIEGHKKEATAALIHEDSNPYDDKAVRVEVDGKTVGYLSRDDARAYRKQLKGAGVAGADATCEAMIVGGWKRDGGSEGSYGVKLDLPTA